MKAVERDLVKAKISKETILELGDPNKSGELKDWLTRNKVSTLNEKTMERLGYIAGDFARMALRPIVLKKIKLLQEDLEAIGVPKKVMNFLNHRIVKMSFIENPEIETDLCVRARICPMLSECLFVSEKIIINKHECFTCLECDCYKAEQKIVQRKSFGELYTSTSLVRLSI